MRGFLAAALLFSSALTLPAVTVDPARAVIVVDKMADGMVRFAAEELRKYLKMITGAEIPVADKPVAGKYPFFFGKPVGAALKPEEARWEVTKTYTRLYGDSTPTGSSRILLGKVLDPMVKSGDLTAVYDFLEKQFGVRFLAPGKEGVFHPSTKLLNLKEGRGVWVPELIHRYMWPDRIWWRGLRLYDKAGRLKPDNRYIEYIDAPAEFCLPTRAEYDKKTNETLLWLKQQRMGRSVDPYQGHAFTWWWGRYGKTHPEYFALVKGKRGPRNPAYPQAVKLCVSNPAVWKQIVENWTKVRKKLPVVNACENDGLGFCECPECRKLDMPPRPGDAWDKDLSDRYVYFGNQVLKEAKKIDPEATICQYAYSCYRFPPRREKVSPDTYLVYVPSLDQPEEDYEAWHRAGARKVLLRPNHLNVNTTLPMGYEKALFDAFQQGVRHGIVGTSWDALYGDWDISGVAAYILARAHVDPSKSFEYWLNEYCAVFGEAASDVRAYYDYFRTEIWEKRLWPNRKAISESGKRVGDFSFRAGVLGQVRKYYRESDFDRAEKLLRAGLAKKLTPWQKRRLETMLLVNEHSRLVFRAAGTPLSGEKLRAAKKLMAFRRANKERLNVNWSKIFGMEQSSNDVTGTKALKRLGRYEDLRRLPISWAFRIDRKGVGEKEKWQTLSLARFREGARYLHVDGFWEHQRHLWQDEIGKILKTYDGIGWYAVGLKIPEKWKGRKIYLHFGAVDESAWIYLNGKLCGTHLFKQPDDWKTPFAIRIDPAVDWKLKEQVLTVKVEDRGGMGGIWQPVLLAVE